MASEYAIEISDYLGALWRRKMQIVLPAIVLTAVSVVAAFVITPVYESTAVILVESPEIPSDLVETTVTGYVQERLQAMQARVLTDDRIWEIAEELDMYPEERSEETRFGIVYRIRNSIMIVPVKAAGSSPTGQSSQATIALQVIFQADTPEMARIGADYLAELVLDVNKRERERKVVSVSGFLEKEAERLSEEMAQLEEKLATFKRDEMDQLPEMMSMNMRQLEQAERRIDQTNAQIRSLQDRQLALEAELALTSPYRERFTEGGARVLSAEEKLTTLTVQFLAAAGRYSADHPDMIRMRREIETLAGQGSNTGRLGALVAELQVARAALLEARRTYSDDHPDVKRLTQQVASLEGSVRRIARAPASGSGNNYAAPPDNPQYVVLQTQLRTAKENVAVKRADLEDLREDAEKYTRRLFLTPAVERDYLNLSRGYDSARRKFLDIKDKQMQALLAERLETQELAERFTLLQAAKILRTPKEPNRKAIVVVGAMFGLIVGIGLASVLEFFDGSVRGFRGVESIFGMPPLAGIQYIEVADEGPTGQAHVLSTSAAICGGLVVAILVLHFLWMPVGEIWQTFSPWAETTEPAAGQS